MQRFKKCLMPACLRAGYERMLLTMENFASELLIYSQQRIGEEE